MPSAEIEKLVDQRTNFIKGQHITLLAASHKAELDAAKAAEGKRVTDELKAKHRDELNAAKAADQRNTNELKAKHKDQLDAAKAAEQRATNELKAKRRDELAVAKAAERKRVIDELSADHQDRLIAAVAVERERITKELDAAYQVEIDSLNASHQTMMDASNGAHHQYEQQEAADLQEREALEMRIYRATADMRLINHVLVEGCEYFGLNPVTDLESDFDKARQNASILGNYGKKYISRLYRGPIERLFLRLDIPLGQCPAFYELPKQHDAQLQAFLQDGFAELVKRFEQLNAAKRTPDSNADTRQIEVEARRRAYEAARQREAEVEEIQRLEDEVTRQREAEAAAFQRRGYEAVQAQRLAGEAARGREVEAAESKLNEDEAAEAQRLAGEAARWREAEPQDFEMPDDEELVTPARRRGRPPGSGKKLKKLGVLPAVVRNSTNDDWESLNQLGPAARSALQYQQKTWTRGDKFWKEFSRLVRDSHTDGEYCLGCRVVAHNRGKCSLNNANIACDHCFDAQRPCGKLIELDGELTVAWLPLDEELREGAGWQDLATWVLP
ncbi:hypothetical protein CC80DRAFT_593656 [Byssothecium circinans]|uniref:Uncharacterized protein n=1 Tax=Byssothecium circinans TaxID=147558 RepID=A0A6A5TWT2_9PLEO|nr:hypothetical protein CC80DRAFT_593656 [Byssothecium circinans]